MPAPSPNILFLCTDQQRYDALGCYGNRDKPPILQEASQESYAGHARGFVGHPPTRSASCAPPTTPWCP